MNEVNLTFYQTKFYEGLLKMIFYKIENRDQIEETLLLFKDELAFLQEQSYVDSENPFRLTEKGLSMMDNSYNVGRMNFVRFINTLLRNSVERAGSFISRLLNLASKREGFLEEASRHLTTGTVEHLLKVLKKRIQEINSSGISQSPATMTELRSKLEMSKLQ